MKSSREEMRGLHIENLLWLILTVKVGNMAFYTSSTGQRIYLFYCVQWAEHMLP